MRATASNSAWDATHPAMEIVPEIGVGPDDLVLPRHQGISPVHRTEVLAVLRNMGISEVVVAGVSTNLAIPLPPRAPPTRTSPSPSRRTAASAPLRSTMPPC